MHEVHQAFSLDCFQSDFLIINDLFISSILVKSR